jgi:hypothetical protein
VTPGNDYQTHGTYLQFLDFEGIAVDGAFGMGQGCGNTKVGVRPDGHVTSTRVGRAAQLISGDENTVGDRRFAATRRGGGRFSRRRVVVSGSDGGTGGASEPRPAVGFHLPAQTTWPAAICIRPKALGTTGVFEFNPIEQQKALTCLNLVGADGIEPPTTGV